MSILLYIHGQGGSAAESEHYRALFPDCEIVGLDYRANTPWDAEREFSEAVEDLKSRCDNIILIANSIGAGMYRRTFFLAATTISRQSTLSTTLR